jgi:hypothetical protein
MKGIEAIELIMKVFAYLFNLSEMRRIHMRHRALHQTRLRKKNKELKNQTESIAVADLKRNQSSFSLANAKTCRAASARSREYTARLANAAGSSRSSSRGGG